MCKSSTQVCKWNPTLEDKKLICFTKRAEGEREREREKERKEDEVALYPNRLLCGVYSSFLRIYIHRQYFGDIRSRNRNVILSAFNGTET